MKTAIYLVFAIGIAATAIFSGCIGGDPEEEDNSIRDIKKEDDSAAENKTEEAFITINGVGYYDWTIYTMGKGNRPEGGYAKEMVLSSISDPKTLNPVIANETSSSVAFAWVFEGLTDVDTVTQQVVPSLAKSWEIGEDGQTYTFYLREDVKFSDGKPMTADDVIFSFNDVTFNEDIAGVGMRDLLKIKGKLPKVEKIDDYTIRITTPTKYAPFLRHVGWVVILPKHALQAAVDANKFGSTWTVSTDPKEIIGTGPYRLTIYENGQRLVQEPNPYYWRKGFPRIKTRTTLIVPNIDTSVLKFKSREIDSFGTRGEDYNTFKNEALENDFSLYDCGPASGTLFLTFNQNVLGIPERMHVWFRDKKFRQAVAHALNVDRIIEEVYRGMGERLFAAEPQSNPLFHNPNVKKYEYDLDKAREMLEEAGYIDYDGDGIREKPKGTPVKFILTTNSGNNIREQSCQIIGGSLKQIGLDVSFTPLAFNNLVAKLNMAGDWHAMILGLTGGVEPHGGFNVWKVEGRTHMYNQKPLKPNDKEQVKRWEKDCELWKNGLRDWEYKIQEIFERGVEELDQKKRKAIYDEWQEIVAEELPYIYLVAQKTVPAVRNKFRNLKPTVYGTFHNLHTELEIIP